MDQKKAKVKTQCANSTAIYAKNDMQKYAVYVGSIFCLIYMQNTQAKDRAPGPGTVTLSVMVTVAAAGQARAECQWPSGNGSGVLAVLLMTSTQADEYSLSSTGP